MWPELEKNAWHREDSKYLLAPVCHPSSHSPCGCTSASGDITGLADAFHMVHTKFITIEFLANI